MVRPLKSFNIARTEPNPLQMTELFQVINSTLSSDKLGAFIQQQYNLSATTKCQLFRAAMNHLYIVTDGDQKFVFRVYTYNWRTKQEISEELRLLLHLKENNAAVAHPISDHSGQFIQEFEAPEGKRYGVLFSYAKGSKTARFSPEASFQIGQALAHVHRYTENVVLERIHYNTQTLLIDAVERTTQFFKKTSDEIRFLATLSHSLQAKFNAVNPQKLRHGAVHLDVWFDNMHLDETGKATFFDFDFCGNGWLCLDLSYFLFQLFTTNLNENDYEAKAEQFLKGYTSEIEMTDEEQKLLPYVCLAIMLYYISIQCDRFDYWTNIFLNEDHLKRFVGNLKRWISYHKLENELL